MALDINGNLKKSVLLSLSLLQVLEILALKFVYREGRESCVGVAGNIGTPSSSDDDINPNHAYANRDNKVGVRNNGSRLARLTK